MNSLFSASPWAGTPARVPTTIYLRRDFRGCADQHDILFRRLLSNGAFADPHIAPVLKFFTPDGPATWLIAALDPRDPDLAYALSDHGNGAIDLGTVRLSQLAELAGPLGLPLVRDPLFIPTMTLPAYAARAQLAGRIEA